MKERIHHQLNRLLDDLRSNQQADGSWRYCFEAGPMTDANYIILHKSLGIDSDPLLNQHVMRIASMQQANGAWKLYPDEADGNLSATIESYYALFMANSEGQYLERLQLAEQFIKQKGGLAAAGIFTKVLLTLTGQLPWKQFSVPLELLLLPEVFPISFWNFVGFAQVHMLPVLLAAKRNFRIQAASIPDLSHLILDSNVPTNTKTGLSTWIPRVNSRIGRYAERKAVRFLLDHIESDGTLGSYATSTFLLIYALLALGYPIGHPLVKNAIAGLRGLAVEVKGGRHLQNSTSTIWDTALLATALQTAGVQKEDPTIQKSINYLLSNKQELTYALHFPEAMLPLARLRRIPRAGWGFSPNNTKTPDVDDTTAALRAISSMIHNSSAARSIWESGISWVRMMQNSDGGWSAFERNRNFAPFSKLKVDGVEGILVDPSTADLTGRTLEFFGTHTDIGLQDPMIYRGVNWLFHHQESNGSWYGRWGICYLYGTWAAVTGLTAIGIPRLHPSLQRAKKWLLSIQNPDGGWGESCRSDQLKRYVPLGASTLSQTAWAIDALISLCEEPIVPIKRGIEYLLGTISKSGAGSEGWSGSYPTGAGLPGGFYICYQSYGFIWPIIALSKYQKKYGRPSDGLRAH